MNDHPDLPFFVAAVKRFAKQRHGKKHGALSALAREIGILPQTLNKYMKGELKPGFPLLSALHEVGFDVRSAFGREQPNTLQKSDVELVQILRTAGITSPDQLKSVLNSVRQCAVAAEGLNLDAVSTE